MVLAYVVEPLNIFLSSLRTWDLFPPVAAIEVLQVFLQGSFPVQLRWKMHRGINWVVLVTFSLFFQSRVDEVQGCRNQLKEKEEDELRVHLSVVFRFWGQTLLMKKLLMGTPSMRHAHLWCCRFPMWKTELQGAVGHCLALALLLEAALGKT